jgi:tRNA pseudouridine13 synthase
MTDIMILKECPEDFIVEEISLKSWNTDGKYAIFKLVKIGLNTEHAVEIISRRFHIPLKDIKYAGTKDRHAHTTQYVSISNREGIQHIKLYEENLKFEHVGYADEPLSLGCLEGNKFIITVRELSEYDSNLLRKKLSKIENFKNNNMNNLKMEMNNMNIESFKEFIVPNYFDEQRFSSNNYNIGLCILKGDFKNAVKFICDGEYSYSDTIRIFITANPNDYVTALKHVPRRTLLMYVHAVQSFIFNEALSLMLSEHASRNSLVQKILPYSLGHMIYYDEYEKYPLEFQKIHLVGFDNLEYNHYIRKVLNNCGLTPRSFIVKAIPEVSVEGTSRECFIDVKNLNVELLSDRAIIGFELQKGSYATNVIKALFS